MQEQWTGVNEGRRSERAVRNENVAWFDTERISTGQISIVGAPSTLGVSRWNKPPLTPQVLEVVDEHKV